MFDFIIDFYQQHQIWFNLFGIISVITIFASIILVPLFLKRIPEDYFINEEYHQIKLDSIYNLFKFIIKNILGLILICAGIIMLFTPGQGVISILIGLFLLSFKGKYKLEQKIISNNLTFKALNWIREKEGVPPLKRLNNERE